MSEPLIELTQVIANKHQVTLDRHDPLLIVQTLNAQILQDSTKNQQALLENYKAAMQEISLRWEKDAKQNAEKILNASLKAASQIMEAGVQTHVTAISTTLREELAKAGVQVENSLAQVKKVARFNLFAAVLTLLAAGVVVGVFILHLYT
jgi:hypothetical protein